MVQSSTHNASSWTELPIATPVCQSRPSAAISISSIIPDWASSFETEHCGVTQPICRRSKLSSTPPVAVPFINKRATVALRGRVDSTHSRAHDDPSSVVSFHIVTMEFSSLDSANILIYKQDSHNILQYSAQQKGSIQASLNESPNAIPPKKDNYYDRETASTKRIKTTLAPGMWHPPSRAPASARLSESALACTPDARARRAASRSTRLLGRRSRTGRRARSACAPSASASIAKSRRQHLTVTCSII